MGCIVIYSESISWEECSDRSLDGSVFDQAICPCCLVICTVWRSRNDMLYSEFGGGEQGASQSRVQEENHIILSSHMLH